MITFYCKCGRRIKLDDVHAGKKGRCPECRAVLLIPRSSQEEFDIEEIPGSAETKQPRDTSERQEEGQPYVMAEEAQATKSCPYCGEMILAIAKKCKHCGEFFDGRRNVSVGSYSNAVGQARKPWSSGVMVVFILLTICLPIIGVLIGLCGLTQKQNKSNGLELLVVSIICFVVYFFVYVYLL